MQLSCTQMATASYLLGSSTHLPVYLHATLPSYNLREPADTALQSSRLALARLATGHNDALLVLKASLTSETPSVQHLLVLVPAGTRGREHAFAGKDGVGTSHEGLSVSVCSSRLTEPISRIGPEAFRDILFLAGETANARIHELRSETFL